MEEKTKQAKRKADELENRGTEKWNCVYYAFIFGWDANERQNTPTSQEQLAAPAVSKCVSLEHRELLLAFREYLDKIFYSKELISDKDIDDFLSQQ